MRYEESKIQEIVVYHVRHKYPNVLLTSSPSAAIRSPAQGARLKRSGHLAGTPDLMLFCPRKGFHALFLELKTPNGKLDRKGNQARFRDLANAEGYKSVVCYGADEAIKVIDEYLA